MSARQPPFAKLLVANRGEIAVRVIRACRDLGISPVAIHSEADRGALHVRLADEALACGPSPATESYLDIPRVVDAAIRAGAEAVHPGYGFLSENGAFADACVEAGLCFVGPSGDVMRRMGDKVTARRAMQDAGVPIVPGTTERLDDTQAVAAARDIGLPVMVKASAGGGGRGLRVVRTEAELAPAIERARAEALASFGDDGLYVEKWIERPRHVEVQILADAQGACVHLFERECSVQRRHQKVVEEAPAPGVDAALREALGQAAVAAAVAAGYQGAGTVEFLLDEKDAFYFLEMNTRIQVEHAITEAVTGIDLVASQLQIAAGVPLPFRQEDLELRGHAIEARIYAEDPAKKFLPSPGRVLAFRAPQGPGIRVDAGVAAGSDVPMFYDPMVAKLITWGSDREQALARMGRATREFPIGGIKTSLPFHRWLLDQDDFQAGRVHTGWVEERLAEAPPIPESPRLRRIALALAAYASLGGAGRCVAKEGKARVSVSVGVAGDDEPLAFEVGEDAIELFVRSVGEGLVAVECGRERFEAAVSPTRKGVDVAMCGLHHSFQIEKEAA